MKQIDVTTLRDWLDEHRPVVLLDVRTAEDRAQWAIPGSIHVNAYEELKAGPSRALAAMDLPGNAPVVAICNRGNTSQAAAEQLLHRGLDAHSLAGGMKAWSLAWNLAERKLERSRSHVLQVRRTGKGCLSYLLASDGQAIVIDASLPPELYLDLAQRHGWVIRYVLDTHIHADHLSRSRTLAERSGATLCLPDQNRASFNFTALTDGQTLKFGSVVLRALATPGHTNESMCYYVEGEALFTGDTLFVAGVGRPDLHAGEEETKQRARMLYRSIERLKLLPPSTLVFPGHTSEPIPFDQRPICAELGNIASQFSSHYRSEQEFTDRIVGAIPPTPPNYERITALNESGLLPEEDPTELEAGANRCAVSQ